MQIYAESDFLLFDKAGRLRLNVATIRNWEQGRTSPDGAAVTLLTLIDRDPQLVMRTLQYTTST